MSELKIRTNGHYREILDWSELNEKEQEEYAYLDDTESCEDVNDCSFFRYKNWTYFLGDFMRIGNDAPFKGWDGYHSDSFFSGVLVKYSTCGDAVKAATYFS